MRKILGCIKKAVMNYSMIDEGDVIGVGVSGGKDSMVLLYALKLFQRFSPVKYDVKAITLTMGFEDFDLESIETFCKSLGVGHIVEKTQIGKIIFDERNQKHPCGMCARMKRGRLSKVCQRHQIHKLALGHHADDAIETLFMSMFYEGRIHTFKPVTYMDRSDITVIRPMIYAYEQDVKNAALSKNIPIIKNPCPVDKNTKRAYVKGIMNGLNQDIPNLKTRLLHSLENQEQLEIWK